jgi:hydrophobic/amphiphilic exporter-1 (mainly G- bacteria), HAE1 family
MKNLAKVAVARPVTFLMISLIVIGFGVFGLSNLRLNLYPDVSFPTVTVYTVYEGVAPEDMETLISRPIEEQVGSISGVVRVRSLSSQGASVVKLYFNWGTDLYQAEADVRKKLDFVRRAIPQDAQQPIVFSYDPNEEPIVVLALASKSVNLRDLRTIATQQLEQRIERIAGIASAETAGGFERQISIRLKNDKMLAYNVDIATVANRLRADNVQVPAGELVEGNIIYSLRTIGDFKSVEQIGNVLLNAQNGTPVFLKDIAEVEDGIAQPIGGVHVQGTEGVIINIYKQSDSNVVTAASEVLKNLANLKKILPRDVSLEVLTNKADFIELAIGNLISTGFQAIVLVVLILLFFLRSVRSSFVIAISIPVSIISTFSIMDFADLSLNVISLSGLTLAVGMVVDNAVVVLENIFRFKEDGYNGKEAAVNGAQEVAVPVFISTLTTLVVFLPILFVPGIAGFLFRDLALTISFALIVSTLVALTLIPLMSSKFLKDKVSDEVAKKWVAKQASKLTEPSGVFFQRILGEPVGRLLDKMEAFYKAQLNNALNNKWNVIIASIILFLVTLPLFNKLGGEFFPPVDENAFVLDVAREPGVSLFELEKTISQVEAIIKNEVPESRLIVSDYGDKLGVEGADNPGGFHGSVRVELTPNRLRKRSQFEITADLLKKLEIVPGSEIKEIRQNPLSPDGENGLVIQLYGYDPIAKKELSDGIIEKLSKIEGMANIISTADQGRPELRIIMDRERISRVGLTTSQVANTIANAVKGNLATSFIDKGLEYDVVVELDPSEKTSVPSLNSIQLRTGSGEWMPLSNLARFERFNGPTNILRINQERVTEIKADLNGIDLKKASDETRSVLNSIDFPDGYRYEFGGSAEEQADSFRYLLIAFFIAAILTYMVMASQFESLVEPFIIIFTIPLAFTGVLLILYSTSTPISVTSMVGLILLSGIVVNNGIVMIDYIKILQSRGVSRFDAILTGSVRRLRPILMTAFTTILSMIPLALEFGSGSETWSPMARTVIGGLTFSTLLMLFVVPCIYYVVNAAVEKLGFDSIHKSDPLKAEE